MSRPVSRHLRCLVLAGLALMLAGSAAQAAGRRVALVIGNSAYRNVPVLANPVKDAAAIAELFKTAGFESVELRQDLGSLELKRVIRAFLMTAKTADIAVFFFAGHGIEVNGENYVIPVDAKLKTDFDAEDEGVALDRIIRAVEPAARLRLVVLDACRDNPFLPAMQRTVSLRGFSAGLGKVEPAANDTLVAYAAKAGSVADDGEAGHSPFTTALLAHLTTPGLDIRVALGRVRDDVIRDTGGKQTPFVYGSLGGAAVSLVPEREPPAALPMAEKAEPKADLSRDYLFAERIGTRDAWSYFLQAHPKGFFADLARAQRAKLTDAPGTASPRGIDTTSPANRRPAVEPPAAIGPQARRQSPAEIRQERSAVIEPGPCERDRETLARLRDRPVAAEIARFTRDLRCDALRPQLARLLESTDGPADRAEPRQGMPAPPETAAPVPPPAAIRTEAPASRCEEETRVLARLRTAPDLRAVESFERDLTCRALQPQVARLRESLRED